MRIKQLSLTLILLLLITGCSGMNNSSQTFSGPALQIEEYFDGKVYAWGIFEDRFGKLRRQFQVEIDGNWDGQQLVLDERFLYSDGEQDRRVWTITPQGDGRYTGQAGDILGQAEGINSGNSLNWRYQMELKVGDGSWKVSFNDWMYLQPGNVMVNRAKVSKWGITLGSVTLFFVSANQFRQPPFSLQDEIDQPD